VPIRRSMTTFEEEERGTARKVPMTNTMGMTHVTANGNREIASVVPVSRTNNGSILHAKRT